MATVEDVKVPYEILIRFGEDGAPLGAHVQYLRRVTLDGEVLKVEIGDALPLDIVGFPTSELMTAATRDALAEVTRLNVENDRLQDQIEILSNQLTALSARLAAVTAPAAE